jgi:prepilin-type N-terminal cleavage/methylation domain-containing protein
MKKIKGINLIEVIIAIIIIGILAVLAIVRFGPTREQSFDREAQENLRLIQAAEKLYRVRFNNIYYPEPIVGISPSMTAINNFLKLDLPVVNNRWNYETFSNGCVRATRASGTVRYWFIRINDNAPTAGLGCP